MFRPIILCSRKRKRLSSLVTNGSSDPESCESSFGEDTSEDTKTEEIARSVVCVKTSPIGVKTRRMTGNFCVTNNSDLSLEIIDIKNEGLDTSIEGNKNLNPFTIDLVVNEVLQYLETQELKTCRLVNRQWSELTLSHFRNQQPKVILTKSSQIFRFTQLMKKTNEFPYANFRFRSPYTSRVPKYFLTFGTGVTCIEIISRPGKNLINFENIFELMKTTPYLKVIKFVNIDFGKFDTPSPAFASMASLPPIILESVESVQFAGWFMNQIVPLAGTSGFLDMRAQQTIIHVYNSVPNTKHLELNIMRATIVQNFLVGISRLRNLETLSLQSVGEAELLHLINAAGVMKNMKSMTFKEVHLTHSGDTLLSLMKAYAAVLENFDVRILTVRQIRIVKFPNMPLLTRLNLDTYFPTETFYFDDFSEQNPFPNLKSLIISQNCLDAMAKAGFSSPSVNDLVLKMAAITSTGFRNAIQDEDEDVDDPFYDSRQWNSIKSLPILFPMMKKLKAIDVRCSALRLIFRLLTNLVDLEINHSILRYGITTTIHLSKILTGVKHPDWLCDSYLNYITSSSSLETEKQAVLKFIQFCSPDSIRNLKNLKTLTFSGRQCIEDSAAHLALLQLKSLEKLVFYDKSICFGEETLKELRKHHKLVQVLQLPPQPESFFDMV